MHATITCFSILTIHKAKGHSKYMNLHVAVNFTARKLFQIFVIKCQPVSRFSYDPISISYLHVAVNFTPEIVRII